MQPMKSAKVVLAKIKYPCLCSYKVDAIRGLVLKGTVMSNSMKPIPNKHIQALFGKLEGFDGELTVGPPNAPDVMGVSQSGVMSREGEPDVTFYVFDYCTEGLNSLPYSKRREQLAAAFRLQCGFLSKNVVILEQRLIHNEEELLAMETEALESGFEGIMGRSIDGIYKFGRATMDEGHLWKLKRYVDSEAEVIGWICLQSNQNEQEVNELGRSKRSSAKDGKVDMSLLGAFVCRDLETGAIFNVGGGFKLKERAQIWADINNIVTTYKIEGEVHTCYPTGRNYKGEILTYKHFPISVKDKPRQGVFKIFRDPVDLP